jgi:hypothetical protein
MFVLPLEFLQDFVEIGVHLHAADHGSVFAPSLSKSAWPVVISRMLLSCPNFAHQHAELCTVFS